MADCIFCKIIAGEIPAKKVLENNHSLAFHDIDPKAPVHVLIIPKKHIVSNNDVGDEDALIMGKLLLTAKQIAKELGVAESGYRLVFNCGKDGGQAVAHLHLHLLAGRPLLWPPG